MFLRNGSVVDAAVATLFCNGLVNSQSMGLGGGFLMTLYLHDEKKAITLDARESAPLRATHDMYNGTAGLSQEGILAVGVPGELKGYWEAHLKYGRLPWAELVRPTIRLCEEGYIMNKHQYDSIGFRPHFIREDPVLRPKKICETLKLIAREGGNVLYNGTVAKTLAADIQDMGGIITEEDLAQYRVKWMDPISVSLRGGLQLYTVPPPGSGILLGFILNILEGFNFTAADLKDVNSTILTYHRMIEAFKFAYARRAELGDPDFINITNGLFEMAFGAGLTSRNTGIILNSGMDDFSIPGIDSYFGIPYAPQNAIAPGKRALSSMCPSIIVDKSGDVRLVIGASGGTKITTAVAYVIMRHFWFNETIKQAVDAGRIHHQVIPMEVSYEYGILDQVVKGLEMLGHETDRYRGRGSIICALAKLKNAIIANADFRKGGDVYGI
ncbi:Gamma-glutamyltranspeptidase 1 [Blattella germanica]|nr:Gamma-glutamyltranspeptidase 1 [Blattella germanica]